MKNLNIDKSSWKPVKFGDVVFEPKETVNDLAASGLEHVVGLEHIDTESIHLRRFAGIEESTTFTKRFAVGDVLFGRRRAYLKKAAQARFDGICSGDITVFRAKKNLLPGLLPFIVNNDKFFDYAVKHSAGGLSPRVKFKDLANYEFLLPHKERQPELAELLWGMDEVIETKIAHLEKSEKCLRSYFEAQIESDGKNIRILREVLLDIIAGKSPNASSHPAKPDEFGVLKVSAVGDGVFVESENKALIRNEDFKSEFEVKNGFILVTRANAEKSGVGRPCLVKNTRPGLMLSDKTLRLVPNKNIISERFLFQLLRTKMYRSFVESVAGGTEAKNISQERLYQTPIWCPSLMEQKNIESRLYAFDAAIENVSIALNSSKALQKSLINEVF